MADVRKKQSTQNDTPLLDWIINAEKVARQLSTSKDHPPKGSLNISSELATAVAADIKHATDERGIELSRAHVAARMTDLLGPETEITMSMLDNWTAVSKPGHRFPAEYLPAFVIATGGQRRCFEVLSRHSGLVALPGSDAIRSEIEKLREQSVRIEREIRKRQFFLEEHEFKTGGAK